MAERTYPNDYFAWYNDDQRLAILSLDTTSTDSSERTTEKYDTFQGAGNLSGTITGFSDYNSTVAGTTLVNDASHDLATGDRITISSSPDSYYDTASSNSDGNYSITVINSSTFYITATYSAEDSGSWTSLFIDNGLRITYKAKYTEVSAVTNNLDTDIGLDTSLHTCLVCYVKSRIYEDQGNFEQANYFRQMYNNLVMKQSSRKSGVSTLAVPNL